MRRKNLTFNLILLLFVLIGLYGCQDELSESARFLGTNREKAILEAQTLYAKQAPAPLKMGLRSVSNPNGSMPM